MQPLTYTPNPMDLVGYGTRPRGFAALANGLARLQARTGAMSGAPMGYPNMVDPAQASLAAAQLQQYYEWLVQNQLATDTTGQ